jgi:hypothetical protein
MNERLCLSADDEGKRQPRRDPVRKYGGERSGGGGGGGGGEWAGWRRAGSRSCRWRAQDEGLRGCERVLEGCESWIGFPGRRSVPRERYLDLRRQRRAAPAKVAEAEGAVAINGDISVGRRSTGDDENRAGLRRRQRQRRRGTSVRTSSYIHLSKERERGRERERGSDGAIATASPEVFFTPLYGIAAARSSTVRTRFTHASQTASCRPRDVLVIYFPPFTHAVASPHRRRRRRRR